MAYRDDAAVAQFEAIVARLARAHELLVVLEHGLLAVRRVQAVRHPVFGNPLVRRSRLGQLGRKRIDFRIAPIAEYQLALSVEYTQSFGDVLERCLELRGSEIVAGQGYATTVGVQ